MSVRYSSGIFSLSVPFTLFDVVKNGPCVTRFTRFFVICFEQEVYFDNCPTPLPPPSKI